MTDKEQERVKEIAKIVVAEIKALEDERPRCTFCANMDHMERHAEQHKFIEDWMGFLDRVDSIRWSVLRNLITAGAMGAIMLVGTLLWRHFKGE